MTDISLLIHTCDNYSKFWTGMLFSLDFNWDFDKVPVYWASEEISIHEYRFTCRDYTYKPNENIRQILTGKTDKNGFSTRMINALKKIDTKWVIYMQEDMWLLSKIDSELISKLLLFSETIKLDSLKIHTKLGYYDKYKLENTEYVIDNIRLQKYSDGDNFLHSHNATIWNREYLINHLMEGEDPWNNEIEGSKRMSSKPHNHYHYNTHWYSQPGVCEKGDYSRDFYTLAPIFDDRMEHKLKFNF
jgi:hypothetical protein